MTSAEREVLRSVRRASLDEILDRWRFEVNAPVNRPEEVQAQRWLGLAIHGELFRRGATVDRGEISILPARHDPV